MALRRAIGLLAIVGVLLHAALVARHHVMSVETRAMAVLGTICRADADATGAKAGVAPDQGNPDRKAECPPCTGMMPAVALVPEVTLPRPRAVAAAALAAIAPAAPQQRAPAAWPPPRGPPARA